MLCENAYYKTEEYRAKLYCRCKKKCDEDELFRDICPLIYWCPISERFENTKDMLRCIYREKTDE